MSEKLKRNDPCHCGSGKKYKNCCHDKDQAGTKSKLGMIGIIAAVVLGLIFVAISLNSSNPSQNCPPGTVWSDAHQHCH